MSQIRISRLLNYIPVISLTPLLIFNLSDRMGLDEDLKGQVGLYFYFNFLAKSIQNIIRVPKRLP